MSPYPCGIKECIPEARICNGIRDCPGVEDELNCGRYTNSFQSHAKRKHYLFYL